jgi:hemerythrin-like metal-binding protein
MGLRGPIAWHDGLSVFDDTIDADHKTLIAIMNEFRKSSNVASAEAAARNLYQFSQQHFRREEAIQRTIGFPDAERHREEHARLIAGLKSLVIKHFISREAKHLPPVVAEFGHFLEDWLLSHIKTTDKAMRPYLIRAAENAVASPPAPRRSRSGAGALLAPPASGGAGQPTGAWASTGTLAGGKIGGEENPPATASFVELAEPAQPDSPPNRSRMDWDDMPARPALDNAAPRSPKTPDSGIGEDSIDIPAIVAAHEQWVQSGGEAGKRAALDGVDISGRSLTNAVLSNASLRRCDLSGCDLSGTDLSGADLREADLVGANFAGTNLAVAHLRHARMRGCNFSAVNLSGADLAGADLAGAIFDEAKLARTNLLGADLSGADLSTAADLSRGQLRDVVYDTKTRLPPGMAAHPSNDMDTAG